MIKEDYVSFEVAKLLKEKGFDGELHTIFDDEGYTKSAITLQTAMKWFRDTHGIQVEPYKTKFGWHFTVYNLNDADMSGCKKLFEESIFDAGHDSYEDAAEAAMNYYMRTHMTEWTVYRQDEDGNQDPETYAN